VHHHPGRLRVRAAVFRGDAEVVGRVQARLAKLEGLRGVHHNAISGSLLIEYVVGELESETILSEVVAEAGLAKVVDGWRDVPPPDLAAAMVAGAGAVNDAVREATEGRADLGVIVPGALLAAAAASLIARPRLPNWENLLYWSYTFFRDLNPKAVRGSDAQERPR
jgi:hypothetical protein